MATTILAAGKTAATTPEIAVADGEAVTVGVFAATVAEIPWDAEFTLEQLTPGAANEVAVLSNEKRSVRLLGPCSYQVRRKAYSDGVAFGVFRSDAP